MNEVKKRFHSGRAVFFLMVFLCTIVAVAVLKLASSVILPFTIAVLLAFVMYPLIKALDKIKCPRAVSILLVVIIVVVGILLFGMVLFTSGRIIVDQFLHDGGSIYEMRIKALYEWAVNLFDLPHDEALSIWRNLWDQAVIRTFVRDFAISLSNISLSFVTSAVLVVLFMVFILFEASFFKTKLLVAFENRVGRIDRMGNEIINQVTRYLGAKFLFSLANGVIYAVSFSLVGLEFAIVWGVVQFLMNFIPTLGSIATGITISLFALIQFWPEPGPIIIVVAIILGVNLILSNLLDPRIIGEHVGISPLMVLISLSIWGYIWGFVGMLIAVPMTVIIKIIFENIPIMEPISVLISSRRSVQKKKADIDMEKQEAPS